MLIRIATRALVSAFVLLLSVAMLLLPLLLLGSRHGI